MAGALMGPPTYSRAAALERTKSMLTARSYGVCSSGAHNAWSAVAAKLCASPRRQKLGEPKQAHWEAAGVLRLLSTHPDREQKLQHLRQLLQPAGGRLRGGRCRRARGGLASHPRAPRPADKWPIGGGRRLSSVRAALYSR